MADNIDGLSGDPTALRAYLALHVYNEDNYKNPFAPGQVIIALKNGTMFSSSDVEAFSSLGVVSIDELTKTKPPAQMMEAKLSHAKKIMLFKLKNNENQDVLDAINKLKHHPLVEYAEPDYLIHLDTTMPNDPDFNKLYGMNKISAPQAWDRTVGNPATVVGVIDTGIDYNHPDLKENIWKNPGEIPGNGIDDDGNGYIDDVYGWDFANNDHDPMDDNGHGTHVAGTIAAVGNNAVGVAGVAWSAKLAALKFLDKDGTGNISAAIQAIDYANKMGIPITNNSWSGGGYSQALKDIIAISGLFVAAAGNNGTDNDTSPSYPAGYDCPNIIAVAATDGNDNLADFSNYGNNSVDIAAPGVNIWSCQPGNGYRYLSGTSMATPHVSGVGVLLKGYQPNISTPALKSAILNHVDKLAQLNGKVASGGRLNAPNTLLN